VENKEFQKTINLCLIYSNDIKHLLLKKCSNGKLDGLMVAGGDVGAAPVEISKTIQRETGLTIPPMQWQIITTLQNIDKKWKIDVYLTAADIESINHPDLQLIDPINIPPECHPNLKWLIPLSIDFTVLGSSFNQILMK